MKPLVVAAALLFATTARASQVSAAHAALSTSSPLATKVGLAVLQRGGNAIDASVAVAFALAVLQPQSGNLGGGGFLVYYDAATRAVWTLDFTELAPMAAKRDMFASNASAARTGALAVAVPGTVAGLEAMHEKFGARDWKELIAPAILLAREGFAVDAELAADIEAAKRDRKLDVLSSDKKLVQPELGATLQRIAAGGAREFYDGDTAKKLVEAVRAAGGILGFRDLREYKAVWRAPIKLRYGQYDVYTAPPPSSGGLIIGETLNIVADDDLAASGFQSAKSLHLLTEAMRRAAIDRSKYVGDPAFARIPYHDLLSRGRAEQWRKSIDMARVTATATLTEPGTTVAEGQHTTHFTVADAKGNVAAVTTGLGDEFGSGFMAPGLGFFLNNAMSGFTSVVGAPNALEPSKRAVSAMSPTIVLRDGKPFLALGTPGGASIPTTILQVFLNVVVYGKSLGDAVAAPRFHQPDVPDAIDYEKPIATKEIIDAVNAMGHAVTDRGSIGDVHAILFEKGRLIAVADPRHGGAAGGF